MLLTVDMDVAVFVLHMVTVYLSRVTWLERAQLLVRALKVLVPTIRSVVHATLRVCVHIVVPAPRLRSAPNVLMGFEQ